MLAAGGGAGGAQLEPQRVRASMVELARALDPRDLPPVEVQDQVLAGPGGDLPIRHYTPPGLPAGPGPGLVFLHGGVGVFGSIETHDAVCRMLAHDAALRVVSVGYRLAPEHPFPAGQEDAWFATGWVAAQAAALGIDAGRLAIGGDSAGATLAINVCLRARDAGGPALAAQLLLCPVTDLAFDTGSRLSLAEGHFLSRAMLDWGIGLYCPPGIDRRDPRVSPLRAADLGRLPPAFIHTAEFDPMRDEGAAYAQALEQAGVPVRHVCHAGLIHHYYGMAGAIPAARVALHECAAALRRGLAGDA
jgi:acetyl esterase/lipase